MGCTIFPKLAARTKREGRACSKGTNPEKNREEFQHHISAEIHGGQQGDGRVFNTKFSKALHA
jgi:hypothetical protein